MYSTESSPPPALPGQQIGALRVLDEPTACFWRETIVPYALASAIDVVRKNRERLRGFYRKRFSRIIPILWHHVRSL